MSKRLPRRGATLAKAIIEEYQPKSVEDMQNALKEIFGPMFEAMLNGEMENHLGYMSNERSEKDTANRRNGYTSKVLKTSAGEVPISVPRDRDGSFTPQIVPKRQTPSLRSLITKLKLSAEQAMDLLEVPTDERPIYRELLQGVR